MPIDIIRARFVAALLIPLSIGLAGCDPDPITPTAPTGTLLTITPSLGMVRNATIRVTNGSIVVGNGSTDANGIATVRATGSGPFIVEVLGDTDAEYFDESAAPPAFLPFRAPQVIRALVPAGTTQVGVTPLTDIAHSLWSANSVPLSNANIGAANNAVRDAFAPALPSILTPPTVLSAIPSGTLTDSAGDIYAAILGGLAEVGVGETQPALAALTQLRRDATDGQIDGMEQSGTGTVAISNLLYPSTGFAAHFQTRVDNRINAWGNTALQSVSLNITALTEPVWQNPPPVVTVPATVNANLQGQYNLTFELSDSSMAGLQPFTDGQDYAASIASGGILTIGDFSLSSPFYNLLNSVPQTSEAVWMIPLTGLELAVSNNDTGLFNEINLFTAGSSTSARRFIGQFTVSAGGGTTDPVNCITEAATLFAAKAGTYTFTAGTLNGPAASLFTSGNTYTATVTAQGGITLQGNGTTSYLFQDYFAVQDCATTPRVRYYAENGLPYSVTLTFDAADSRNANLVLSNNSNSGDNATFSGVPDTSGGTTPDEEILALLNGRNGHLFSINGSPHRWKLEDAQVERFSPTGKRTLEFGQQFFGTPADMTPFNSTLVTYSEVEVARTEGDLTCASGNARVQVNLTTTTAGNSWHGTYNSSDCNVRVLRMSDRGTVEGIILSATLSNGTETITLANSPFRVYMHPGNAGSAPAITNDEFMTMNIVNSGAPEFTTGTHFRLDRPSGNVVGSSFAYGVDPMDGSASENSGEIKWIVQNYFFSGNGPFNCGTIYTASSRMNMRVWLGTYLAEKEFVTPFTSGCTITMDSRSGSFYQASYTGTLSTNDATIPAEERTIEIAGQFRNYMVRLIRSNGDEGALGNDENAATLRVDNPSGHFQQDDRFKLPFQGSLFVQSTAAAFDISIDREYAPDADLQLRLRQVPTAVGQYQCGTAYNGSQSQNPEIRVDTSQGIIYYATFFQSGAYSLYPGASCTINITQFGDGFVVGDYTATLLVPNGGDLIMPNSDNVISVSGSFRMPLEIQTP